MQKSKEYMMSAQDRDREEMIDSTFESVDSLRSILCEEKTKIHDNVMTFLTETAFCYDVNWKGNASLFNFDKNLKVTVTVQDKKAYDERLNVAREKMIECLDETEQISRTLIESSGPRTLLKFQHLKIEKQAWKDAMQILRDAVTIIGKKTYMNFYKKTGDKWERVVLDFQKIPVDSNLVNPALAPRETPENTAETATTDEA